MKNFFVSMKSKTADWFPSIFFEWEVESKYKSISLTWLTLIYIIGLIFGAILFDWGKTPFNFADWSDINLPRLNVIQDALKYRILPLHTNCERCMHGFTDRFFVLPDVITTPQMMVLFVMNLQNFVFLDVFIHFTAGVFGLLYLRKKFRLSLIVYSILFFLFNFNGYIVGHYVVGNMTWAGYFLFPWFFIFVFELVENEPTWLCVAKIALLSFYVILAGGQHHFVWMMLFLTFFAIANPHKFKWVFRIILFAGFLSAVRLLPPVLGLASFTTEQFEFQTGYPGFAKLLTALMFIYPINYPVYDIPKFLGYWELNYFVGIVGVFLIFYFGIWKWLQQPQQSSFSGLLFPIVTMLLLTQGYLYKYTLFSFPLLSSERVTSRMVAIPITLLLIIGSYYLQEFLRSRNSNAIRWTIAVSFIILVSDLLSHLHMWNIKKAAKIFPYHNLKFAGNSIIAQSDPQYVSVLLIGLVLTLLTFILLIYFVVWENKLCGKQL